MDHLWSLSEIPSITTLHKMFYSELRELGFRAHHVKQIYIYAKAIVRASKQSGGRKPVLRRLTARIDRYDYRLDLDGGVLTLKIHDGREVKLRLLTSTERVEKFGSWSSYEIAVKVVEDGIYVAIYFRKTVKPRRTRTVMTIDVNFDNITLAVFVPGGELLKLKRYKTPLRRMLTHRIWIERIQKRYSRSWRFIKGVRRAIRRHGERIKSIAWDYAHKIGDSIAELASRYSSIVVLENLNNLRDRVNGGSSLNKKLSLWFYRRIQFTINYETLERGFVARYVNPGKTSSTCPRCGSRLKDNGGRVLRCPRCGFTGDRDVVACINLFYRYSRCGCLGVPLNTPKPNENPSGMQRKRDEAMTSTYINLHRS
ncbi:MAG: zinc ribbon domain-containing protein [Ignisphaera sp.]|uniref:Cas12f1-like TNB domain-containing protein n=1 Tax=Ignisphaera aggregans TaxID=334771 RepID=A0A7J3I7L2_9CREN